MFGNLFGSKSKKASQTKSHQKPAADPKLRRGNITRRFQIIAEVGQGSMSKVYRAVDNENGRLVCLKVQDREKTAAALQRAEKEGRPPEGVIGAQIKHQNVVRTFDYGMTHRKEHWLTMEFIEGVSLDFIREPRSRDLAGKIEAPGVAAPNPIQPASATEPAGR